MEETLKLLYYQLLNNAHDIDDAVHFYELEHAVEIHDAILALRESLETFEEILGEMENGETE